MLPLCWLPEPLLPPVLLLASLTGLAIVTFRAARGAAMGAGDKLALGALLALAAWPAWLLAAGTGR